MKPGCRERKSDERTMKYDRRMNMTTLQTPSMERPEASVRLVILCPSAQCSNRDQLEGFQCRRRRGGAVFFLLIFCQGRSMCVYVQRSRALKERQRQRRRREDVKGVLCRDQRPRGDYCVCLAHSLRALPVMATSKLGLPATTERRQAGRKHTLTHV